MVLLLHGVAGGWDEIAIAVAALGVLWVAVKLAGRKGGNDDEDEAELAPDEVEEATDQVERHDPAHSSRSRND
jgi:hypothetical protein